MVSELARREATTDPEGPTLTHIDGAGHARMVDVTGKPSTHRRAVARCRVDIGETAIATFIALSTGNPIHGQGPWEELLTHAEMAGIQAAKQTARLIPLCHPLDASTVHLALSSKDHGVDIEATAEVVGQTGVEMEALTACAFAALTVTEALVRVDPEVSITDLGLWEKSGGRSGTWVRQTVQG